MAHTAQHKNSANIETHMAFSSNESSETNVKRLHGGNRRANSHVPPDLKLTKTALVASAGHKVNQLDQGLSGKIANALNEDGDPAQLLADIRGVLFGPTRQLHEARMEELVVILEEADRAFQGSVQKIQDQIAVIESVNERQANELASTNHQIESRAEKLASDLLDTNKKMDDLSESMFLELQRSEKSHKQMISDLSVMVDARFDRLAAETATRIDDLSSKHNLTIQALVAEFTARLQDLTTATKVSDEKILSQLDSRVMQVETHSDEEKRRSIQALTEGFAYLSERVLALHNA